MKGKKLVLVFIAAAVLAVGWLLTVRTVTGSETLKKQRELVLEADGFSERGLYIRAIPLYQEALTLTSAPDPEIQEKLLATYSNYGNLDAYVKLVEKRISAGTAGEEELLKAADYYLSTSKLEEAMTLVKKGMDLLGTERLEQYYEEHRYPYKLSGIQYSKILPGASGTLMPAYNGEKWGYIDTSGREALRFIYDSATAFNEYGYAVVSVDGTYYTILESGDIYGADDGSWYPKMTDVISVSGTHILGEREGSYSYFDYDYAPVASGHQYDGITANACGVAAVKRGDMWGIITDSGEKVVDFILEDVAVNSLGCAFAGDRAMVKEGGKWHLIDTEGNRIGANEYADAKAPESEGYIAVADSEGRWGYINRDGESVIECQYKDARSFSDHLGAVQTVNDWGYISEKNILVIKESLTDAAPFHNGIAPVGFGEGECLLILNYFEQQE